MRQDDIVAYVYRAEELCPQCTLKAVARDRYIPASAVEWALDAIAEGLRIDRTDESSFDSEVFPKVVFRDHLEECHDPRCDDCGEALG
jgi:hypothetical protein